MRVRSKRSVGIAALCLVGRLPIVLLFPERSRIAAAEPDALQLVACLELENAELHRQVVELALQIQDLKERRR